MLFAQNERGQQTIYQGISGVHVLLNHKERKVDTGIFVFYDGRELMTRYLREHTLFGPLISAEPSDRLGMVVVIPAKDETELETSLGSLLACQSPRCDVEVIVVVNTGEADSDERIAENTRSAEDVEKWAAEHSEPRLRFHILQCHGLKRKHAGVGLARKIGMDEACRRLEQAGNSAGVIVCFDADSGCDDNYLVEIERLFRSDEKCQACSIHFEHPVCGDAFEPSVYEAIIRYELHLRYFIHAQKYARFPHAVQTIGSSMAVRCDAYQEQNGMNKRQAGEDFYFFHKFTPLGNVRELRTTCVLPSPRRSHRVPFGTGKAVGDLMDTGGECLTYSPKSFVDLRVFLETVGSLFEALDRDAYMENLPSSMRRFLESQPFWDRVDEIRSNVTSAEAFRLRFFRWFNAFLVMKFVHSARDHEHPNVEVSKAAGWLLGEAHGIIAETALDQLMAFRALDRAGKD